MIFFGRGNKSKQWIIDEENNLLVVWSYFHLFRFPIAFSKKRYLIGDSRSEDRKITYKDVKELFPDNTPDISLWQKYGLLIILLVVPILAGIAAGLSV